MLSRVVDLELASPRTSVRALGGDGSSMNAVADAVARLDASTQG